MEPIRRCLGCHRSDSKDLLVRIVVHEGRAIVDRAKTLPGRGGYVHPDQECVTRSIRSRVWGRALKQADLDLSELNIPSTVGNDERS
jgi:predicted RNA-binding protein YlxR (DUF448 family)